MMWFVRMKAMRESKVFWKAEQLVGRGMDGIGEFGEDLLRGLGGIDLFGDAGELGLVAMQIVVADFKQVVERDVDHLVVAQLLREGSRAQFVVAI
jgi:hypothetical protein